MFYKKNKESKIFNNNLPLFNILCLLGTIYLGCWISPWYFLLLVLVFLISLNIKLNKWQIIISLSVILLFVPLLVCLSKFSLFVHLSSWLKCSVVRQNIFAYFDSIFNKQISSFIKLFLFNVKSEETYEFYKQTVDLNIVWLICTGGFHISFLSRTIYKIFRKHWKIGRWLDLSILVIYSYLLNFSFSSMRVLFILLLNPLFNKYKIKSYNKIGFIGIIFSFLNPCCFQSYSFLLSFIGVTSAYFVQSLDIENKFITSILISVLGFASTIPFVINMNHKISLLTFINSFIFSYLFAFVFIYFLIFSWIPFMAIIHYGIMLMCYYLIGNISFFNLYIWVNTWQPYIIFAYYSCYYAIIKILYLIVYNNKI